MDSLPAEITSEMTREVRQLCAAWRRSADLLARATMPGSYRAIAERTERERHAAYATAYRAMLVRRTVLRTGAPAEWAEAWA
ncbi:hypothetical protein [Kineococcus terrestris]|uniref:hypothetical protein n=1 Tax=Kineococcus terrestris TaxID=2044856 RepID=UPI0034DAC750